jgi:hypothetical protein
MKFLFFLFSLIFKTKKKTSPISDAVAEGINDTFKEMGYGLEKI